MIRHAAACIAACAALAAAAVAPVAFVADVTGNATIEGNGRLNFLAELAPGTKLLLGTGATVAVTYAATGTEFTLRGPGEYLVGADEVRAERGVKPTRRTVSVLPDPEVIAKVSRTANASLRMRGLKPGDNARIALEYPVNTRVTSLQPTLRWRGDPASDEVAIVVADLDGKEVWRGKARASGAKTGVKLSPQTLYTWTVMTPNGVRADGRFETLSAAAMAKAEKSRAGARTFPDRVLHAFVLQEVGATQDAREAWAALARERPDLPELSALAH